MDAVLWIDRVAVAVLVAVLVAADDVQCEKAKMILKKRLKLSVAVEKDLSGLFQVYSSTSSLSST